MPERTIRFPTGPTNGPLSIHPDNPRYFADRSGKAVYLTGSHNWSNVQEISSGDPAAAFDYAHHLGWLLSLGHNYTRGWHWEQTHWNNHTRPGIDTPIRPLPYARTGPGSALDGLPKYDLRVYDEAYFERLRARVREAGVRGIYFSVMLFQGFSVDCRPPFPTTNPWEGHPYHIANNVNGIDGSGGSPSGGRASHTLRLPEVTRMQEAYVRKVIDTVNDLDNVLYEIGNEHYEESFDWQCHMVRFIKEYEKTKPHRHPVGMTSGGGSKDAVTNAQLFSGPADWVSPREACEKPPAPYCSDPPPADGRKVILADTDHLWGLGGNVDWVWRSFTRGLQPVLMDPYETLHGLDEFKVWGPLSRRDHPLWDPIRRNMGYARHLALGLDLARAEPRPDLASGGYCLAWPGHEYVVYTGGAAPETVELGAEAPYALRWLVPETGELIDGGSIRACGTTAFTPPVPGPAVLHLRRV